MGLSRSQFLIFAGVGAIGATLASGVKALSLEIQSSDRVMEVARSLSLFASKPPTIVAQNASELVAGEPQTQLNLFQAIVLGFVQGMTEFIPISSTAHLKVVPVALGWGDPGVAFSAVIQLGSIAAVLWYFWQDLSGLIDGALRGLLRREYDDKDFRIVLGIGLGTVPIVVFGLIVKYAIPEFYDEILRSLTSIAIVSIVMALLLAIAERIGVRKRNFSQLTLNDGVLMGMAQVLALIPGVSRSGSTITAGLFMGLERATAARFSFLLGIPAISLAGLVELKDLVSGGLDASALVPLLGGLISSTVFSYMAIAWLIQFLKTQSTWVFVWYRLAFGVAILATLFFGVLPNS